MARFSGRCWKCSAAWEGNSQPGRGDDCPKCGFDLHTCRNCKHHDIRYNNECRIPETESVRDRERSNFCDQFEISPGREGTDQPDKAEEARKKFNQLFGGSS